MEDETLKWKVVGPASESADEVTPTLSPHRRGARSLDSPDSRLQPGDQVERYSILHTLGSGGMGVVYAAYDPRLDRKIALKLLRRSESRGQALEARLLREAQALAQLNDPHVLTVYDVGTFGDQIYLAIEHVEGTDLSRWLKEETRTQAQILDVFVQAGRGLAAAHRQGLVHRDFKPGNVMVRAQDGRALVLDFGLARSLGRDEQLSSAEDEIRDQTQGLDSDLTRAGSILGTPVFMAPEQWQGEPGAAADQFSFCASLYLALYGEPPFERSAKAFMPVDWTVRPAPEGNEIPARLRKCLLRGLSYGEEERFPSMEALLKELADDPARRRNRRLAAVAMGGLVAAAIWFAGRAPRPCQGAGDLISEVWGAGQRLEVIKAFSQTPQPYGPTVAKTATGLLDEYATAWSSGYADACEATHVRGDQSPHLLDRRVACLEQRRRELDALVTLFVERPEDTLDRGIQAVDALSSLADCADTTALMAPVALPENEKTRQQIDSLRQRLASNRALLGAGRYEEALEQAQILEQESRLVGYLPLVAEALVHLGQAHDQLDEAAGASSALQRAIAVAHAGSHQRAGAEAFTGLVRVATLLTVDFQAADFYAELAENSLSSLDRTEYLRAELADNRGLLALHKGDLGAAASWHLEAVELNKVRVGSGHPAVARSLVRLGTVLHDLGRVEQAGEVFEEALSIQQESFGERHPEVAATLDRLGNIAYRLGDLDRAFEHYQGALEILLEAFGADSPKVARTQIHWASALSSAGDHVKALELFFLALDTMTQTLGDEHPNVATLWSNIGTTRMSLGNLDGSLDAYRKALELQKKTLGDEHMALATTYFNLGEVHNEQGDFTAAERLNQQALGLWRKSLGDEHYLLGHGLSGMGRAALGQGDNERAADLLEQALELWRGHVQDPMFPAWTRWLLAQARADSDPDGALALAAESLAGYRSSEGEDPEVEAEIEKWLEARRSAQ